MFRVAVLDDYQTVALEMAGRQRIAMLRRTSPGPTVRVARLMA